MLPTQSTSYQARSYCRAKAAVLDMIEGAEEPASNELEMREYRLNELVDDGKNNFQVVKHKPGITQYVKTGNTDRAMIVIAPGPNDSDNWDKTCKGAVTATEENRSHCHFSRNTPGQQRGPVDAVTWGISIGNGQPRPMMLNNQGKANRKAAERIRETEVFQNIAGFMTVMFLTWAPKLFLYYICIISTLLYHQTKLTLPFANSIFTAFTVNFSPRTVCLPHCNTKNLAFGWCAITALGKYDHTKGRHLVLWDLKMVIEFPPGTTIFIPSAMLCHFNTAIQEGETRYSFTMYSAGGLSRWVEHGFQLENVYRDTVQAAQDAKQNATRWV
ncbi:hypothetical protein V5O48_017891 [Marasmius crinis-equi]|uniref:Uncharacterized protein n=1 Tax=Marasmius crinis-equi TaxID=585013 RepID=A0ABR3EMS9_9AGAR